MANQHTSLFLPEEHRIISDWLKVAPAETLPDDLALVVALKKLGLDTEVLHIHTEVDHVVAAILLERVQSQLPQWASAREGKVFLARDYRDRAAERVIEITPRHLFTLNWADSGPGFSWPEAYHVTYVPIYDVFIVTGSVDCTDLYGVTDFALGHFPKGKDIVKASGQIILEEWYALTNYEQHRWAYLFDEGLIDDAYAQKLADAIWDENGEPLREARDVPEPEDGITAAIRAAFPSLTEEQIEDWAQTT